MEHLLGHMSMQHADPVQLRAYTIETDRTHNTTQKETHDEPNKLNDDLIYPKKDELSVLSHLTLEKEIYVYQLTSEQKILPMSKFSR